MNIDDVDPSTSVSQVPHFYYPFHRAGIRLVCWIAKQLSHVKKFHYFGIFVPGDSESFIVVGVERSECLFV